MLLAAVMAFSMAIPGQAEPIAKQVFGAKPLPADLKPSSIGFYSRGCLAGGVAIPVDGPTWQVMRLSRNRRWGHPAMIGAIEELSIRAKKDGWNGLMVGDISQPRGGPMLTGHASHQIGLDADLWFTPMPDKRLTYKEREELSAISMLRDGSFYVDDRKWTKAHERLLFHAASLPKVERVLVHPGIKKKLCETVKGDRTWLQKVRPIWGHNYHFHVRIACQDGSPECRKQERVASGEGCDSSLDWWFKEGLVPKKKKADENEKPKRELRVTDLPPACINVVDAAEKPEDRATFKVRAAGFEAPDLEIPDYDPAAALRSKPIEARGRPVTDVAKDAAAGGTMVETTAEVPVPSPRPKR